MVLGGCGNVADGARADQFNGGSSTGQRQQHGGRPLDWEDLGEVPGTKDALDLVMELQIGVAAATMMQVQVVPKAPGKSICLVCCVGNLHVVDLETQVEKETQASVGNLETCRSGRLVRKKVKEVNSLYS
uniref:Uncharacterized protein n=1 Tax=Aegilops tauschii TaxID=37682 RepID=M8C1E9_AEGTA